MKLLSIDDKTSAVDGVQFSSGMTSPLKEEQNIALTTATSWRGQSASIFVFVEVLFDHIGIGTGITTYLLCVFTVLHQSEIPW